MLEAWLIDKVDNFYTKALPRSYYIVWYQIGKKLFRAEGTESEIKAKVSRILLSIHGLGYFVSNHNVNEINLDKDGDIEVAHVTSFKSHESALELLEFLEEMKQHEANCI